jgi:RNA polymerase sigma factor (sigma-70 family)
MKEFEDKILVTGFLTSRSEYIFRQLYRKHTLSVFRIALQLTRNDVQGAEDVVQEAWIRAITHLHEFKWKSSFRTWITGIAINCSREYMKRMNRLDFNIHETMDTAAMARMEAALDLHRVLALLPTGYREILLLHDLEGFKHEEIATLLGISEGTSKSQLFHARNAVKKILN